MSARDDSDVAKWQVITVFREAEDPVLSTAEITAELPIGKRAAQKWLKKLLEDNKVQRKKVGSNTVVWWLDTILVSDISGINVTESEWIIHHWPLQLSLSECSILSSLDIPGDRSQVAERRHAIMRAYLLLREQEEISKRRFIDELFFDNPAGYSNENSWWERLIRKNLKKLPPVVKPQRGGKWKFDTDEDFLAGQIDIRKTGDDPTPIGERVEEKIDHPPDDRELQRLILSEWKSNLIAQGKSLSRYRVGMNAIAWLVRKRKATKDEFLEELFLSETIEDEEYWWQECVQPAIERAIDYGYIEYTYEGYVSRFPVPE